MNNVGKISGKERNWTYISNKCTQKCLVTDRDSWNVPSVQKSSARIQADENMSRSAQNDYIQIDCVELLNCIAGFIVGFVCNTYIIGTQHLRSALGLRSEKPGLVGVEYL